ncbi:GtrA family protein [Variovorax saccharolyticus]|uniref:GtrA family protein n=1 Tax=Variovorax saccharolyticus TaxID=3053516 RepID=UPI00336A795D
MQRIVSLQFFRFLAVGVVNSLTGLAIICGAKYFFEMGDISANALGYAVGICVSFMLNSRWTFDYEGPLISASAKFLLVTAFAYGMNLLVVIFAIRLLNSNTYLAQALGAPAYTLTAYLASKHLVFRSPSSLE